MDESLISINTLSWAFDNNCLSVCLSENNNPFKGNEEHYYRMDVNEVRKLFSLCKDKIKLIKTKKKKFTYLTIELIKQEGGKTK